MITPVRSVLRWWRNLQPPQLLVLSFLVLIALGTTALMAVPGMVRGEPLGLMDALFTMTSAVCVTGLSVIDISTRLTFQGQFTLLVFIQLGGLGLITLTTLIIGALGARLSLRSEMIGAAALEVRHERNITALTTAVMRIALLIEGVGAVLLWLGWLGDFPPMEAAWHAVFHSVSAFCNAGFSTFGPGLTTQAHRPFTLMVISALIILGGLGYLSGEETLRWLRRGGRQGPRRMSSHTYAVLVYTAVLLVGGAVLFTVFEWFNVLGRMGLMDKLLNGWFMSVTARTAGFNTVSYAEVSNGSAYLTILLMVVGGAPGSTAGGIKVTALAVLVALAIGRIRGRRYVELHGRAVPPGTVERTVSVALLAFAIMTAAIFVLSVSESGWRTGAAARSAFLPVFFEVVSAFCTVGLTMDLTPTLSVTGRLVAIILMFVGRVGLLSFFAAIALKGQTALRDFRPAQEDVIVG